MITRLITKILGIHYWLHSDQGKRFLALYWDDVKRFIPKSGWLEWAYWKLDDPDTGYTEDVDDGEESDVDFGIAPSTNLYEDRHRAILDNGLNFYPRKQPKSTCGQETVNNGIALMYLGGGAKPKQKVIAIEQMYEKYKSPSGGTNTTLTYPKLIDDGVAVDILEEWGDIGYSNVVDYFSRVVINSKRLEDMLVWAEKAREEYLTTGKTYLIAFSKHNSKAIPTYGVTVPKIKKNSSTKRTGGHIACVDWLYGRFNYKGKEAIRIAESSYPKGGDSWHIYTEDILKINFNKVIVLEFKPEFWAKAPKKLQAEAVTKKQLEKIIKDLKEQIERLTSKS